MRFRFLVITCIGLTSLVSSCNYESEGIVITDVKPPSLDGITIDLNNSTESVIQLKQKTTFTYTVITNGKQLISSKVYLKSSLIWSTSSVTTSFTLDPELLATGSYNLRIEVLIASETGSLADKLGAEAIIIWADKTVIVDNEIPADPSDPNAVAIVSVENIDNTIKISWNKYNKFNFEQYQISRLDYDENGNNFRIEELMAITDQEQNSTNDHSYLSGKSAYVVTLRAAGKTYKSPEFNYEHPYKPALLSEINSTGDVTIKWTSAKALKSNLFMYRLEIVSYSGQFTQIVPFDKYDAEDTVVNTNIPNFFLGDYREIRLKIFVKPDESYPKLLKSPLRLGREFPVFSTFPQIHFDVITQSYYANMFFLGQYPRLNRISADGIRIDSIQDIFQSVAFANGSPKAVGVFNSKSYKIDLQTMNATDITNFPMIDPVYAVSKDLKIVGFNPDEGVKVFSESGQSLLTAGFVGGEPMISPDGNFVTASNRFYKFNGSTYDIWSFWTGYQSNSMCYLDDNNTVIIGYSNKIVKYNLQAKSEELTTTTFRGPCNFDPISKKIGCRTTNKFVVLNPADLSLVKSIEVNDNGIYYLLNETILCPGAQIKLSDIQ
jgi:hypothetical protein